MKQKLLSLFTIFLLLAGISATPPDKDSSPFGGNSGSPFDGGSANDSPFGGHGGSPFGGDDNSSYRNDDDSRGSDRGIPPSFPGTPTQAPVGGLGLLAVAGVALGLKKIIDKRKK